VRVVETIGEIRSLPLLAPRPRLPRDRSGPRTIALIAHDAKETALLGLARAHVHTLMRRHLLVTATTGRVLRDGLGLEVEAVDAGPEEGDLQIRSRIVNGAVDAVVFLRDPLAAHPHEPDIQALLEVCDVHGVPVATNVASGDILLRSEAGRDWWLDNGQDLDDEDPGAARGGVLPFDDDRAIP
jgi:methylglyoxal synthase